MLSLIENKRIRSEERVSLQDLENESQDMKSKGIELLAILKPKTQHLEARLEHQGPKNTYPDFQDLQKISKVGKLRNLLRKAQSRLLQLGTTYEKIFFASMKKTQNRTGLEEIHMDLSQQIDIFQDLIIFQD